MKNPRLRRGKAAKGENVAGGIQLIVEVHMSGIPAPACIPPKVLLCTGEDPGPQGPGYIFCLCEVPAVPQPPRPVCTMTLQYERDAPKAVWLNKPEVGCDQAGLELALAAILAKLLAGAPLP